MQVKYIDKHQYQLWIDGENENQIKLSYLEIQFEITRARIYKTDFFNTFSQLLQIF